MKKKIVVIESAFGRTSGGHYEHFIDGFFRSINSEMVDVVVLAHRDSIPVGSQPKPRVVPACTISAQDRIFRDRYDGPIEDFKQGRDVLVNDLNDYGRLIGDADLYLLPTASSREIAGLAKYLKEQGHRTNVACIFHWGWASSFAPGSLEGALLRQAIRALDGTAPHTTWFGATQLELASSMKGPLGRDVVFAPSLTFFNGPPKSLSANDCCKSIGFLGGMRHNKGGARLEELVGLFVDEHPDINIELQAHGAGLLGDTVGRLKAMRGVNVIDTWLDEGAVLELCRAIDIAVLPYEKEFYRRGVSGVFTLVSGMGIPCIVPSGTWMSDRISSGEAHGVVARDSSSRELLNAFSVAQQGFPKLAAQSSAAVQDWRKRYSAHSLLEGMFECLFGPELASQMLVTSIC